MTSMKVLLILGGLCIAGRTDVSDSRTDIDVVTLRQIADGDLAPHRSEPADDIAVDDIEVVLDHDHVAASGG